MPRECWNKTSIRRNFMTPSCPIIHETLTAIVSRGSDSEAQCDDSDGHCSQLEMELKLKDTRKSLSLFLNYRGKVSENSARVLQASCRIIFTFRKLKTILPSLKPPVQKLFKSGNLYKTECSRCNSSYVGQTSRHLQTRFKEHLSSGPVQQHFEDCDMDLSEEHISILGTTSKGEITLLTLEALWIRDVKPQLNTKDEFRSRALTIKL